MKTSLFETHQKLGGRMVDFAGWQMPVQYAGVIAEHLAVRDGVGIFDVSHMGEILVRGAEAKTALNRLVTNDLNRMSDGDCQYNLLCYENGCVVDDIIVYQKSAEDFLIVVNAANKNKDFAWFKQHLPVTIDLQDVSDQNFLIALQGPKALQVLAKLSDVQFAKSFTFKTAELDGIECWISRTGYTGEDGVEIGGPWNSADKIWRALSEAGQEFGIQPCGLAARNTLRLEACYSLYGHEITDEINPLEARLAWAVKLDKESFIGKEALEKIRREGIKRQLIGLELIEKGIPRDGCGVFCGEEKVGWVTSGTFSPSFKKSLALALVSTAQAGGRDFSIEVRDKKIAAVKVDLPFYQRKREKN